MLRFIPRENWKYGHNSLNKWELDIIKRRHSHPEVWMGGCRWGRGRSLWQGRVIHAHIVAWACKTGLPKHHSSDGHAPPVWYLKKSWMLIDSGSTFIVAVKPNIISNKQKLKKGIHISCKYEDRLVNHKGLLTNYNDWGWYHHDVMLISSHLERYVRESVSPLV